MNFTDIYRIFHPFSSETHRTFSKKDHILGHKASLSKCKKIENNPLYSIRPNGKKLQKMLKYMETKQYIVKQPVHH
jgi:hypothetical protein